MTPHVPPIRLCPVCERELPAGYGRHPQCDARWLQPQPIKRGVSNE